jgi:SAM-dependent methyltransferase
VPSYSADFYRDLDRTAAPSAARIVPRVLALAPIASVVDVGCGDGSWLAAFSEAGVADILGLDGPWISPHLLKIATRDFRRTKLDEPIRVERRFELAMSVEVAEHLPAERAEGFVADLCALAPAVLFSAAVPGQGGDHHVNEQWPAYWAALFAKRGYRACDVLRPEIWQDEAIAWWYRQNLVIFADGEAARRHPKLAAALMAPGEAPNALIHPQCYARVVRRAEPHFGRWLKMGPAALSRGKKR